ncbi:choice-of-anchor J domain-containing protein [Duganella sp. sic0402]|uniref:choice-of-anchor J domain-containing protein n=1 Tax=Duganella sp. sic0402 TaxID=2854786 RepID=UPI001C44E0A3|nr:choice-of-anchor J domain-containing protein [Duganella sp. sic0402]MBV7534535.1 choice-of-anchor J domain-containing protein [Duganella sp. sic0402]
MDLIKRLAGLLAVSVSCSAVSAPLLVEGFDNVAALAAKGWLLENHSAPPGSTGWFQGDPAVFAAAGGPADSYIAANFNNAAFGGAIDNWLITPQLQLVNGESLNFSLRLLGEGALDRVEVYLSSGGGYALLAGFESAADTGWLDRSVLVSGLAAPAIGRFAFRYVVDDTSLNGNYIGLDTVSVNAVAEPATIALFCLGVIALRRRKRPPRRWRAIISLPLTAMAVQAAHADEQGVMRFPHVTVVAQPAAAGVPGQGGMTAYKDPQSGRLSGPTAEQAAALAAAARTDVPIARRAPPQIARPGHGGISLKLEQRQFRYALTRKPAADAPPGESQ